MADASGKKEPGQRLVALLRSPPGVPLAMSSPPCDAGAGAEVDDVVGPLHDGVVVLDDEQGVALVAQRLERGDEPLVVAGVQADGRLVEHVEHAGEVGAELGGEPDALGLAAGERLGGPVERKIAEADVIEETSGAPQSAARCPA